MLNKILSLLGFTRLMDLAKVKQDLETALTGLEVTPVLRISVS